MTTLELARQLDCVYTIPTRSKRDKRKKQPFDYLLVLDFEATCWEKTAYDKGQSEIIEFPCVLYDVRNDQLLDEFQQYVIPTERPKLTEFCKELTGIQQSEVDDGVPLKTCLFLFQKWRREQVIEKYNISFENSNSTNKTCIIATWSDWDLGMCLKKELKRKRIPKDEVFDRWVDVRSIFVDHYEMRPKGLEGALRHVNLEFEGRQHCGLHDARNTARLIGKMISDGAIMRMTKDTTKSK